MQFFICIFAIKKWALSEGTFPILDFLNVWFIISKVKVLSWNLKNNITREACSLKLSCNTEHGLFFTIKRIGINQHTYSLHDMIVFHKITFFEYFFYSDYFFRQIVKRNRVCLCYKNVMNVTWQNQSFWICLDFFKSFVSWH